MTALVIGGGPAGMSAAIAAARQGEQVILLERMDRVGKKLLATGNGRCNLMNTGPLRYPGGGDFARQAVEGAAVEAFLYSLGLTLREKSEGRVYPASGQASTVLDALRLQMERLGVRIVTGCQVTALEKTKQGFTARTSQGIFEGGRAIVCGGGQAAPKLGSDGSAYGLLRGLGHEISPLRPALTQLRAEGPFLKGLAGIRVKARLWVTCEEKTLARQAGEALFTDYGVSGVCAMQLSRFCQEKGSVLHLDLRPALGLSEDAESFFRARQAAFHGLPLHRFFTGLCVTRLGEALVRHTGLEGRTPVEALPPKALAALAQAVSDLPLPLRGVNSFDAAQVTWGGADPWAFDPATLESLLCPGLHAAGEILDVDGDCGGFNLMFAIATGVRAGENLCSRN